MTVADTLSQLRSGEIDLLEYTTETCDKIEVEEPRIKALVPGTYERKRVLGSAFGLLERYPRPPSRPALFGVPVGVKDIFRVSGFPTRCGSNLPAELFDGPEAACVKLLRKAGAIILGKTATTEFAYLDPGPTRNPHNIEYTPGGSSSGSAAGVACSFFSFALGTQTVGSIIRPAAYCGVVGFKPSYGRIPVGGVMPFAHSADHVGLFSSGVSELKVILPLLCVGWKARRRKSAVSRKQVLGVPEGPYLRQASASALDYFESHLTRIREAGYEIRRTETLPHIDTVNHGHLRMIAGEMARVHKGWFKAYKDLYGPKTSEIIQEGLTVSDRELVRLRSARAELRLELEKQMKSEEIDLWICPSATGPAPFGLQSTGSPLMNLPWTFSGLPTISLPAGLSDKNLPLGIQVVAPYMEDELLISASEELAGRLEGVGMRSSPRAMD